MQNGKERKQADVEGQKEEGCLDQILINPACLKNQGYALLAKKQMRK